MPRRFIELEYHDVKTDAGAGTVLVAPDTIEAIRPHYGGAHHDEGEWSHTTLHMRSGEVWPVNATIDQIEEAIAALVGKEKAGDISG